jgi:CRISPR-associated protein (TIGR02584 family)
MNPIREQRATEPTGFPRRILLAVTGLTPQVVTETLYALAVRREPAFVPTEVVLLTTAEGAERARLSLLSAEPGWFARLVSDYDLPSIDFDPERIRANPSRISAVRSTMCWWPT